MSTDRVEINPDNTNKPLEQSQEDLAKQGVNVNEGVVNNNGESVNISQPETEKQTSDQEVRPNWLPEKFASAEDLAKAYGELEKKMSHHGLLECMYPTVSIKVRTHDLDMVTKQDIRYSEKVFQIFKDAKKLEELS